MSKRIVVALAAVLLVACAGHRAETWNGRGADLAEAGKYEESVKAFGQAIQLEPRLAKAHYNMGLSYMHLHQADQAAACFRRALEIDPAYTDASQWLTTASAVLDQRHRE